MARTPGATTTTEFVKRTPMDSLVLTLACGKYRFNDLDLGEIGGIPRILDVGQCNDAYSAVQIALALAEAFGCTINELPSRWCSPGTNRRRSAFCYPCWRWVSKTFTSAPPFRPFLSETVVKTLVEAYNLQPITDPQQDLDAILHRG